jgi:hypothetical protein
MIDRVASAVGWKLYELCWQVDGDYRVRSDQWNAISRDRLR